MISRLALLLFVLIACSPNGAHKPTADSFENRQNQQAGSVGYDQVKPIFAQYCSACHPSRSAPDWLNFTQAQIYAENGKLMQMAVTQKRMPPPGSPQAASIPNEAREKIRAWVQSGAVEHSSSPASLPSAPSSPQPQVTALQAKCLQCHGSQGPGSEIQPRIPILAGQNAAYIRLQLDRFKWRSRLDPTNTMNDVAAELTKNEIADIAQWFSSQPGLAPEKRMPMSDEEQTLFEAGKKIATADCVSCHMNRENGDMPSNELLPALAGQSRQYLVNQLLYFRDEERRSPLMHEFARSLTIDQIDQIDIYF
jgi:cytochrome c553